MTYRLGGMEGFEYIQKCVCRAPFSLRNVANVKPCHDFNGIPQVHDQLERVDGFPQSISPTNTVYLDYELHGQQLSKIPESATDTTS